MPADDHILIVAHDIGPVGGMERVLTELIGGLVAAGKRVTVVARTCELPAAWGVEFVRVPGPARPFTLAYPWFMLVGTLLTRRHRRGLVQATGAIVLNRVDVFSVHLSHHGIAAGSDVLRAARDSRAYRVNARIAAWMSRLAERLCYSPRRGRRYAAVSAGVARELASAFPGLGGRARVVPNGVDTDRFRPAPAVAVAAAGAPLRAVFVGGDWERKGLELAIAGVAAAPGWALDVVGAGDEERFRALAEAAGAGDRVVFHGRRDDPEAVYATADAFVFPTAYETFSLVTYEAAASGLPVLATRVSGIEDLVEPGVNGWFVERDAADIARRLEQLGADPELRAAMGRAARVAAERFTWSATVDAHLALYRELAA